MPPALQSILEAPTASALALRALRRWPGRIAFQWDGGALDYRATLALIGRLQAVLDRGHRGRGGRAPRLALLSANRPEAWCVEVAAQALGGVVTWLHPMGSLPDQLEQLRDAEVDTLVVDAVAHAERGRALAAGAGLAGDVRGAGGAGGAARPGGAVAAPAALHTWTLGRADFGADLLAAAEAVGEASPCERCSPDDPATLSYTGGTTGKSKAALRRQRGHAAMARAILADFELPAAPRYLAAAPISHVAGTKILPTLLRGGTVHLMPHFDPGQWLATVQRERIGMGLLVPTMIYALLDDPAIARTDLCSLELLLYGASPMAPARLAEGIERIGPVFAQLYGQTECYPISLLARADHDLSAPGRLASCGQPVASCEVRLLDADGREAPPGEVGEICVRAPHAMEGYWRREALSADTLAGGWLHTGDLARRDAQGYLYIVDRSKDMIVSGGFNVYPREVEDVLASDPAVAAAAVVGVPDPKWGEAVLAVVVPRPGARVDAQRLVELVRQRKGAACAPKRVEVVDALPTTAVGKVDKKAIRAPHWAGASRQVG